MGVLDDYEYNKRSGYTYSNPNGSLQHVASFDETAASAEKIPTTYSDMAYDATIDGVTASFELIKAKVKDIQNDISALKEKYLHAVDIYEKFSDLPETINNITSRMDASAAAMIERCDKFIATAKEELGESIKMDTQYMGQLGNVGSTLDRIQSDESGYIGGSGGTVTPSVDNTPTNTPTNVPTDTPTNIDIGEPPVADDTNPVIDIGEPPVSDDYTPIDVTPIIDELDNIDIPTNVYAPPNPTDDYIELPENIEEDVSFVYAPPNPQDYIEIPQDDDPGITPVNVYAPPNPIDDNMPANVYAPPNPTEEIIAPALVYAPPNPIDDNMPANVYAPPNPTEEIITPALVYAPPNPTDNDDIRLIDGGEPDRLVYAPPSPTSNLSDEGQLAYNQQLSNYETAQEEARRAEQERIDREQEALNQQLADYYRAMEEANKQ